MYKSLLLLCLVGMVCAGYQNIDDLLNQIFKNNLKPTDDIINNSHKSVTVSQPSVNPSVSQPQDSKVEPCTTANGTIGQCVPFYLCERNNTVITDGYTTIDIRVQVIGCNTSLDVCCMFSDVIKNPSTPLPRIPKRGCGWRNPDGIGFKTIGDIDGESKFGEFPWMVAILKIEPVNDANPDGQQLNVYVGGGSLIHPAVVLTTAHYVVNTKTLKVRAGEWDTQTTKEIYPYQDRDVDSIIVHEGFNTKRMNLFYDIALLFLSSPMDTSIPNVGLACLPPPRQRTPGGQRCVASGWGKDKFGKEGRYQVILKKVTVPVVERNQCVTQLRKTRLGHFFELHSSFMCAGGEAGIDTCKGDGGSPLMCPIEDEPNRYMQSGMVAWGIGCGQEGIPGVYVDVSSLRYWIDNKIAGKGLDSATYTI